MQQSTIVRAGATLTAAVLAASLGTASASAAEAPSGSSGTFTTQAADQQRLEPSPYPASFDRTSRIISPRADINAQVTTLDVSDGVLFKKGANSVELDFEATSGSSPITEGTSVTLRIKGKNHSVPLFYYDAEDDDPSTGTFFFDTQASWGAGTAQLLNTTFVYEDGTSSVDGTDSNSFKLRQLVRSTAKTVFKVTVYNPGNKIKFQARGLQQFKASSGKYVALSSIRLQYRKSGSWKTLKKIKLNSAGNGSYTYEAPKRTYRLYVPTTASVFGGATDTVTG